MSKHTEYNVKTHRKNIPILPFQQYNPKMTKMPLFRKPEQQPETPTAPLGIFFPQTPPIQPSHVLQELLPGPELAEY